MYVVSDLDLHCLHMPQKKTYMDYYVIGLVNNLFPGHLSTATVLGNYSLYAVKYF